MIRIGYEFYRVIYALKDDPEALADFFVEFSKNFSEEVERRFKDGGNSGTDSGTDTLSHSGS